ncbi:MAG: glycosyltransferase [Candidatus Reddybacter sp.]
MAEKRSIVTVDWRRYGDFSAVGQLTKKIFSEVDNLDVYPIQVLDQEKCRFFRKKDNASIEELVDWPIYQDAAINLIRNKPVACFYVRLSPHKSTLEFACKLACVFGNVPLVVHFMDTPHLGEMRESTSRYIMAMYNFLMARADRVYTIHDSSVQWVENTYKRRAYVLGNFIKDSSFNKSKKGCARRINVSYFGSIDLKMNAAALISFARLVSKLDWAELSIWSNSGVWGELKDLNEKKDNINVKDSHMSDEEYSKNIQQADYLLLPYNIDDSSVEFLKYSYSNKFIDYVEGRGKVICFGSPEIPSVRECIESRVGIVVTSLDQLEAIFSSIESLSIASSEFYGANFENKRNEIKEKKYIFINEFKQYLSSLEVPGSGLGERKVISNNNANDISKNLEFLIKRKFFDKVTHKQSLAATISACMLKSRGYRGFDYEV